MKNSGSRDTFLLFIVLLLALGAVCYLCVIKKNFDKLSDVRQELKAVEQEKARNDAIIQQAQQLDEQREQLKSQLQALETKVLPDLVTGSIQRKLFKNFEDAGIPFIVEISNTPLTKAVMGFSDSIIDFWYLYLGGILAIIVGFRLWKHSEKGSMAWARFLLRCPVVGKAQKATAAARFTRTMSTLLRSGISVLDSMEITSHTLGNKYLEAQLYDSRNEIRKGSSVSRSIRGIKEFPPMIYAMTAIGEESGTLDSILDKAADSLTP